MTVNTEKLKARIAGFRGETVTLHFVGVELKDRTKPTPSEDVLVGYLRKPIKGLDFASDEDGRGPLVRVKTYGYGASEHRGDGLDPIRFFDLPRGRGQLQPVEKDAVLLLENAYFNLETNCVMTERFRPLKRAELVEELGPDHPIVEAHEEREWRWRG